MATERDVGDRRWLSPAHHTKQIILGFLSRSPHTEGSDSRLPGPLPSLNII